MSDKSSYMREKYKRIFRRRMVTTPEIEDLDQEPDLELGQTSETLENGAAAGTMRKAILRRVLIAGIIILAILITIWITSALENRKEYTDMETVWEKTVGADGSRYQEFGSCLLRYSPDGMAYLNTSGEAVWDYGYSMKDPVLAINGDYGIIGDRQAQSAVVFGVNGIQGTITTTMPILNVTISAHGVSALMLDDADSSVIQFYDRNGLKLDIAMKNVLTETSGYPMDLSLSPKGTGLMLSLVYLDQGTMQSRVAFLNFDVGKTNSDRVVGVFPYGEALFPDVEYLNDTAAVAFGDRQVEFYSLKNEASPELVNSVTCDSEIRSVFTGNEKVAVVMNGENGRYQLRVYDSTGKLLMARDIPLEYTHAEFSGEYIVFYTGSECLVLNLDGNVKYQGSLEGNASKLYFLSRKSFLQFGDQMTKEMKLK